MSRSSSLAVVISLCLLLFLNVSVRCDGQFEGDACTVDNAPGICRKLQGCQSVYQELLKGQPPKSMCGYASFEPIVCCPTGESVIQPLNGVSKGAIARQKCAEYAKSVYTTELPPILSADRTPVNKSLCALRSRTLIVGGTKADPKEFPHMAAIGYNSEDGIKWSCGGTLISDEFVLTAAHCLFSSNWGSAKWARLGDLNLQRSDDDAKPQNFRIIERIKHPKYQWPSAYNDIALVKLEEKVKFNAWIRPSCIPYSLPDIEDQGKAVATGWGLVDWTDYQSNSNDLLKVTIKMVPHARCNQTFGTDTKLERGIIDESQICAGDVGKDTCQGDSGGPLAIFNSDQYCMYSVVGITSLGKACGSIFPGVYTRVYHYLPWIEKIVWPDSS
ncbi:serine protease snk [Calliopsis andreniformis]|uniref:serine protease snk n=1 Tax=Calliopsis andreniformis TaxID=337506 RepID=UPI003FCCD850